MGQPRKWPGDTQKERDAFGARMRRRLPKDPVKYADDLEARTLQRRYGLTPEDVDALVVQQKGKCAVCAEALERKRGKFAIDHCHSTKHVRGLLCHKCNIYVGFYEKIAPVQDKIAAYLSRERN